MVPNKQLSTRNLHFIDTDMVKNDDIPPNAPAGGGGPGNFQSVGPVGANPNTDKWMHPGPLGTAQNIAGEQLKISGVIVAGGSLSQGTIVAINKVVEKTPVQWRRYIGYSDTVKVGGSLAWRANNPGNLRAASTKIGTVPGAAGHFAVFATMEEGRSAQKELYVSKYGGMKVRDAINKLTPPNENDTAGYLAQLKAAGVDLDKDVKSQIDTLMKAVEVNEGLIQGIVVKRVP
jgi:hypothetical protein